jgi:hypothetical protein
VRLFVLLAALIETISDTIKENAENRRALEEKRRYENIDWDNIKSVTFHGTETAYRIEEEEEYDPMYTNGLSAMNGAPCYGTRTVRYRVEDGENYNFTILYKTGVRIHRTFHETSPLTERLLEYCGNDHGDKLFSSLFDTLDDLEATIIRWEDQPNE